MYAVQVGSKGIEGVRISQNIGQVCLFEKRAGCGMRISDWSSDVCSSGSFCTWHQRQKGIVDNPDWHFEDMAKLAGDKAKDDNEELRRILVDNVADSVAWLQGLGVTFYGPMPEPPHRLPRMHNVLPHRLEEHTYELQSLTRISYAIFCLK